MKIHLFIPYVLVTVYKFMNINPYRPDVRML